MYSAGGGENFLTLALQENYIPPTHRKNDTSLKQKVVGRLNFAGPSFQSVEGFLTVKEIWFAWNPSS